MCAAHERGIVLCGYSAGSMCWFEQGITKGVGHAVRAEGLGLLAGSHCVHYSQDPDRRTTFLGTIAAGELDAGLALDDHAAAVFRDGRIVDAVRSRESSGAWWVRRQGDRAAEERIETRPISAPAPEHEPSLAEMRDLRRRRRIGRLGGGPPARRR